MTRHEAALEALRAEFQTALEHPEVTTEHALRPILETWLATVSDALAPPRRPDPLGYPVHLRVPLPATLRLVHVCPPGRSPGIAGAWSVIGLAGEVHAVAQDPRALIGWCRQTGLDFQCCFDLREVES